MSVPLRSITGKVDYQVEQLLRDLVKAVNANEDVTQAVLTDQIPQTEVIQQQLSATVGSLGDLARTSKVQGDQITNIINGTTPAGAATVSWGDIIGNIVNQLDLQAALDAKQNIMVFDATLKAYVLDADAQPVIF